MGEKETGDDTKNELQFLVILYNYNRKPSIVATLWMALSKT